MSSTGQPEDNDVTRRPGSEVRLRHPAGGARLWQRLRTARRGRLRLSLSRRHVLAAIQDELQADAELAATFSAFASMTAGAAMPKIERLSARSALAGRRAFLNWRIMLVVGVVAGLVAVLALALTASSPAGQARCDPAYAFAPACHGPSWAPLGVKGQVQASYLPPASYGYP